MKRILALILIFPLILTGCWDQKIYEHIGFILNVGAESSKDGKMLLTFTSPVVGEGKMETEVELIEVTGGILREGRENARKMSSKQLESGKLQQFLISSELAQKRNVHDLIEIAERDPILPIQCWLVIVDGSPNELIKAATNLKEKPRPSIYIDQLLENSAKSSNIPETRLSDFDIEYLAPGLDPMLPLIKLSNNQIKVIGSALFSKGSMTGKLNTRQSFLTLAMMGKARKEVYSSIDPIFPDAPSGGKEDMATELRAVKRKIKIKMVNGEPVVNIYIVFAGYISEYRWDSLARQAVQKEIESYLSERLKKDCIETISILQQANCDAIGIGDMVRAKCGEYWKSVDWEDVYRDIVIDVDVNVNIKQFGVID